MSLKRKPAASDGSYAKRKKLGPLLPAVCSVGTSKVKRTLDAVGELPEDASIDVSAATLNRLVSTKK